jgi:hypothetical protein
MKRMEGGKMMSGSGRGRALWGVFLVVLGGVLLLGSFVDLGLWLWVIFLTFFGLAFYAYYAMERTQKWLLIPSYILLAIAAMLVLIELDVLRGDVVALFVFAAIAIPFLYAYFRNRRAWWYLIPAYVMIALFGLIGLDSLGAFMGDTEVSYIMFAIALPFLYVYVRNTKNWWALIPGGIMAIIGFAFLFTAELGGYIGPAFIILVGLWVLFRGITRPKARPTISGLVDDIEEMASQIESEVESGVAGLMEDFEDLGVTGKGKEENAEEQATDETDVSTGEE